MVSASNPKRKALVVDDQQLFREAVAFELECIGMETETADGGKSAFALATEGGFDLIVSDIRMPDWDGERLLTELRGAKGDRTPFVFMSGYADLSLERALAQGADAFVGKPLDPDSFAVLVEKLLAAPDQLLSAAPPKAQARHATAGKRNLAASASTLEEVAIGRRGLSLRCEDPTGAFKIGDTIALDLIVSDPSPAQGGELRGRGILAWVKAIPGTAEFQLGIELQYLEPGSLEFFLKMKSDRNPVASIPF